MKSPRKNEIIVAFTTADGLTVECRRQPSTYTHLNATTPEQLNAATTAAIRAALAILDHTPPQYRHALNAQPLQSITQ